MQFGGSAARVFTTLQEVDDQVILIGFLLGFALNGVLLLQIVYYNMLGFGKQTNKKASGQTGAASPAKRKSKKAE
jgi:mannose-P-dolichol utilization defect protein 1